MTDETLPAELELLRAKLDRMKLLLDRAKWQRDAWRRLAEETKVALDSACSSYSDLLSSELLGKYVDKP